METLAGNRDENTAERLFVRDMEPADPAHVNPHARPISAPTGRHLQERSLAERFFLAWDLPGASAAKGRLPEGAIAGGAHVMASARLALSCGIAPSFEAFEPAQNPPACPLPGPRRGGHFHSDTVAGARIENRQGHGCDLPLGSCEPMSISGANAPAPSNRTRPTWNSSPRLAVS